jgi:MOSC domain-containing protein YiiM/ribosomal protein S18 acetylase RimI-like enzyme
MTDGDGRVVQVNVSPGGVPKLPVERAWVGHLGLEGDDHHDATAHGGPHRAVALFGVEAIGRVRAEGHPIFPGSCGENLTTEGIELSRLPVGTRLAIGETLVLELSKPDGPCETIAGSFTDGRFARISIKVHPDDSRMYARVLREGPVRPGDRIRTLPPAADSAAGTHVLMERVDAAKAGSDVARWQAAREAGFDVEYIVDDELAIATSHDLPGPAFNRADGLGGLPHLAGRAIERFRRAGTPGWLPMDEPPWPGARAGISIETHVASPDTILARAGGDAGVAGLAVRTIGPDDLEAWISLMVTQSDLGGASADAWRRILPHLARAAGHRLVLATIDGRPIGVGLVAMRRNVGFLRSASVSPEARGQGVQRALVAERARLAAEAGADLLAAGTAPENAASVRNLRRLGFETIWSRAYYRFDPTADGPEEAAAHRGAEGTTGS